MNFYAYQGGAKLGQEKLGSDERIIIKDLKTLGGAVRRCQRRWGNDFRIYSFADFRDNNTFAEYCRQ